MSLTTASLNQACNAIVVNTIQLHSGDPGADGTANVISNTSTAITLGAAAGGVRSMASPLDISVPATTVSHYTLWEGATLKAKKAFAQAEVYASPGTAKISTATLTVTSV